MLTHQNVLYKKTSQSKNREPLDLNSDAFIESSIQTILIGNTERYTCKNYAVRNKYDFFMVFLGKTNTLDLNRKMENLGFCEKLKINVELKQERPFHQEDKKSYKKIHDCNLMYKEN